MGLLNILGFLKRSASHGVFFPYHPGCLALQVKNMVNDYLDLNPEDKKLVMKKK